MHLKYLLRSAVRELGYDITSHPSDPVWRFRKNLIEQEGITTILDVGANVGQFSENLRTQINYKGRIVSFEPLSRAFADLNSAVKAHSGSVWEARNHAVGNTNETLEINVSGNSVSSSLLPMMSEHEAAAPESKVNGKESVEVKTLDSIYEQICSPSERVYLKIDTQGYEHNVILGANETLPKIRLVQMELSMVPLYHNELLFGEMCDLMDSKGFDLVSIEQGFGDPKTSRLLQVDGVFLNRNRSLLG